MRTIIDSFLISILFFSIDSVAQVSPAASTFDRKAISCLINGNQEQLIYQESLKEVLISRNQFYRLINEEVILPECMGKRDQKRLAKGVSIIDMYIWFDEVQIDEFTFNNLKARIVEADSVQISIGKTTIQNFNPLFEWDEENKILALKKRKYLKRKIVEHSNISAMTEVLDFENTLILTVEVCVDQEGNVIGTEFVKSEPEIEDEHVKTIILSTAKRNKFESDFEAEQQECGWMTYTMHKSK